MKLGPSFKLSKEVKRRLCFINNPHQRGKIKKMFISAQLHSENAKVVKYTKETEE